MQAVGVAYTSIIYICNVMWKTLFSSSSFEKVIFPSAEENAAYFMMHKSRQFKFRKKTIVTICKNRNHFSLRTKLTLGTKTNRPPFSASWVTYHFCEIKCWSECEHFFLYTFFLLRVRIQWITLTYVDSLTCYFKVYVQICVTSNMVWRIIFDGE